jgi:hypothetical protein
MLRATAVTHGAAVPATVALGGARGGPEALPKQPADRVQRLLWIVVSAAVALRRGALGFQRLLASSRSVWA